MQNNRGMYFFAGNRGISFFCYALSCFDKCPEKRDESNPYNIGIGWLQFIPFFGTLQSSIF
jgi:hypothetical protein